MKSIIIKPKDADQIGTVLKQLREEKELPQKDIIDAVGSDHSHISRIESGKINPSFPTIISYLKAVGYSVHFVEDKK